MSSLAELSTLFYSQLDAGRLHHGWIIEGVEEPTLEPWLLDTSSRLLGKSINQDHFHPNLFWLSADDAHNVDAARDAIHFLEKTSWDGSWKVAVILGADRLNTQAQNALLKMLEEPPEHSIIILGSESVGTLLPTLYSRGMHIVLSEAQEASQTIKEWFAPMWLNAATSIAVNGNYEALFNLQKKLDSEDIDSRTQAKLILQLIKAIIDGNIATPLNVTTTQWIDRWTHAQTYLEQALFFQVDQNNFCVKLTAKLLNE